MNKHSKVTMTDFKHSMGPGEVIAIGKDITIKFEGMATNDTARIVTDDGKNDTQVDHLAVGAILAFEDEDITITRIPNRWSGSKMLHIQIELPASMAIRVKKRFPERAK